MRRTTKKLAGKPLEQFLKRFFLSRPEIDEETAQSLARASRDAFASARIDALSLARYRRPLRVIETGKPSPSPAPETDPPQKPTSAATPRPDPVAANEDPTTEPPPFDPYGIGLIPTFQREGADGLMTRLAEIVSPAHLRKMARAQQIALPAELRTDGADANAIREAIVKAVAKRIADRRAAAG